MKRSFRRVSIVVVLSVISFMTGQIPAYAQATRTWVSGVGDDVNPCSRTAPCKTFAGAISKTAAKGEINVLDPGGFGAVTITKAITIDGGHAQSGVLTNAANAINVSAGVNDVVRLRNLDINGLGTANDGIKFNSGAALLVTNVQVYGFANFGINIVPSTANSRAVLENIEADNNGGGGVGGGINIAPTGAGSRAAIIGSSFDRNEAGVRVGSGVNVSVSDSYASGNVGAGFESSGGSAVLNIESSTSSFNGTGVLANSSTIRISNVFVTGNQNGLSGATIVSFGNNSVAGNFVSNGAPTQTVARI